MLEVIFEDDHDTAAFLHLIQQSDDRRHFIVREGIKKVGIARSETAFCVQRFIEPILVRFFWNAKKTSICFRLLRTHTASPIRMNSSKSFSLHTALWKESLRITRLSRRKSRAHSLFQMRSGRFHLMRVFFRAFVSDVPARQVL